MTYPEGGLIQHYVLAQDVVRLGKLHWVMETSTLKTVAGTAQHGDGDDPEVQDHDLVTRRTVCLIRTLP
ncbi:hypothetical protein [Nonomuraea sp. 10N515B]|uniref:hypothetical protein n=1 Tax=Nonomuraea sp. 10N515B TaxID=3457422 RepID=UPI003FCDE51A